jgi:hypothetical protein
MIRRKSIHQKNKNKFGSNIKEPHCSKLDAFRCINGVVTRGRVTLRSFRVVAECSIGCGVVWSWGFSVVFRFSVIRRGSGCVES